MMAECKLNRETNTPLITVDVAGSSDATSGLLGFVSCG